MWPAGSDWVDEFVIAVCRARQRAVCVWVAEWMDGWVGGGGSGGGGGALSQRMCVRFQRAGLASSRVCGCACACAWVWMDGFTVTLTAMRSLIH